MAEQDVYLLQWRLFVIELVTGDQVMPSMDGSYSKGRFIISPQLYKQLPGKESQAQS